jgi:hypothetical protein
LTLANGGHIIRIRPIAIGMEVVPMLSWLRSSAMLGTRAPRPIPTNIARKIQTVRYLFKNDSFFGAVLDDG